MNELFAPGDGTILLVDDTPENLGVLSDMLETAGYTVQRADSGQAALESIHKKPPDLILLDIMMPGMTGFEVCEKLKADETTEAIPVIFISALNDIRDRINAFNVGGVDYIAKPFFVQEVLARVRTHLALRSARRALEEKLSEVQIQNEELDAFAHTVAHDLKNPITILSGYLEFLRLDMETIATDEQVEFLAAIDRSVNKMRNIVEELLLLAGIRKQDIIVTNFAMDDVTRDALTRVSNLIKQKDAIIHQPESWPEVQGHPAWIEEVWVNYLSNAIKYGGQPPHLWLGWAALDDGRIHFWVRDNGKGISADKLDGLFTPFERLDQAKTEGYGLGLSIVLRIIEKLNGEVTISSEIGVGSTFGFILPSHAGESPPVRQPPPL